MQYVIGMNEEPEGQVTNTQTILIIYDWKSILPGSQFLNFIQANFL